MRDVTVAASLLADMVSYLRVHGVDADSVCRRAGIDPSNPDDGTGRIRGARMSAFWTEAIAATGDANLGFHTTIESNPGTLDIVGYVMLSSRTADDALRRGARLIRLLNDGIALEVERGAATTRVRLTCLAPSNEYLSTHSRQIAETVLAGVVYQLRLLTARPVAPAAVTMRHSAPPTGVDEYATFFRVAPRFGAGNDELVLHNTDVDVELRSANSQLLAAFEAHADATLAALAAAGTLSSRVSAAIVDRLKGEPPAIGAVARALAMSPRHLQRGLSAEGTTYQALLDDARRELAIRHLSTPQATVAKVAWLVGFSDPSAFHRAFRRWTGTSPRSIA
jgi:AraC-like DNA-binding protein